MSDSVLSSPSGSASHVEEPLAFPQPRPSHSAVRTAQPEDEAAIIALGQLAHDDNGLYAMDVDPVLMVLRKAWQRDNVIIGVIGPVGAPVGCVVLSIEAVWYAAKPIILELVNIVHPDHRAGKRHAESLIEFAKKVSDQLEIPLTMGIWSNKRTEAKVRFYRRLLEPAGEFFVHNRHLANSAPVEADAPILAAAE